MQVDTQLSLFEQASAAQPGRPPELVLRDLCEQLIEESESEPPVDVERLASMRGIVDIREAEQSWAGMLLPNNGRMQVQVRAGDGRERQRFTVLHETGHTMLPGFSEKAHFRCGGPATEEEQYCDLVASELLFPRKFFVPDLQQVGFGVDGLETLAARYQAGIEATAIRVVDIVKEPALIMVFRRRHKPSERGRESEFEPKLRLDWTHSNGDWPYFRKHKSVDEAGVFARAFEGEVVDEYTHLGPLAADGGDEEHHVSARRFGNEVIALVRHA